MSLIVTTPAPPYYSVIFTSLLSPDDQGYGEMADRMVQLAHQQDGFLGVESARGEVGITVSYWRDLTAIKAWKANSEHLVAQKMGRERWYQSFTLRIAKVERQYSM
ncbi:antibiotic biosynthesis monooxygenase family protein [Motilimonas pumila]|uniref:Antibiotic biosynthesis monooxygenase n=1 Tax=Motilimonas pumila TaxID=2303987 RepID=A0A418YBQ4_9GAMM|nr:antibiotic biosynthesis monooxygenase [Motilimonas pumila]RJG41933.1 antibiotic biosynthesis monooxygenase [Motilimonas pumila]